MPGLRSLVARRRCSLPSAPISSEPVICTYPSVPGTIASRKGHSLDEVIKNDSIPDKIDNVPPDEKLLEKFQSPPKQENKCLPGKPEETKTSSEEHFHCNIINSLVCEKENYNGINHDNNHSELESPVDQNINSQSLESKEIDYECNFKQVSESVSPERIIIKMKLLHGSSLSDVTNISSESSSDCSETLNSDHNNEDSKRAVTHWTIDSILNKPVSDKDINIYANNDNEMLSIENESLKTIENTEKHKNNNDNISIIESESSVKIKGSKNLFHTELNNSSEVNGKNLILKLRTTPEKNLVNFPQNFEKLQTEPTRRPSDSSEISEDSVCSESSIISSDSSLKSCSIVIKRLENSNTYSCFRSPKSKRKRGQLINKKESAQQENQYCKKNSLLCSYNMSVNYKDSNVLPCSVTLCDIFSNYPFPKEICPSCSQYYDIESDMYVDICSNTLTLQCCNCKWLVVKRLKLREIDIIDMQSQNCGHVCKNIGC